MKNNNNTIVVVYDKGDMSVGCPCLDILTAELDINFSDYLKEEKLMDSFTKELKELVNKYFEPETKYEVEIENLNT